jgi:hypothetical protein
VIEPEQIAVTGAETLIDSSVPIGALSNFYRAFNSRDLAMMARNWDTSEECSMDNPIGGIKRSWAEIRKIYEHIFSSQATVRVEFHDYTMHRFGEMFVAVGRERGTLEVGTTTLALHIRTTRIFRQISGRWHQIHHHGSIDDADLLAKYQAALR